MEHYNYKTVHNLTKVDINRYLHTRFQTIVFDFQTMMITDMRKE